MLEVAYRNAMIRGPYCYRCQATHALPRIRISDTLSAYSLITCRMEPHGNALFNKYCMMQRPGYLHISMRARVYTRGQTAMHLPAGDTVFLPSYSAI